MINPQLSGVVYMLDQRIALMYNYIPCLGGLQKQRKGGEELSYNKVMLCSLNHVTLFAFC